MKHQLTACVAGLLVVALVMPAAGCRRQSAWQNSAQEPGKAQAELPKATLDVGGTSLAVEVADTDASRQAGYMYREKPTDSGMLFVYPAEQKMQFIMMNVKFDIDIAFITAEGRLDQIEHMKAFMVDRSWDSLRPAQYALEVPAGWFADHKVAVGAQVTIPAELAAAAKAKADAAAAKEAEKNADKKSPKKSGR